jgi:hypothetical protein
MVDRPLAEVFPGLRGQQFEVTSPKDDDYNCIAWAAGDNHNWWWPSSNEEDHWPEGVARVETLNAFRDAFAAIGYVECPHDQLEAGYEKIAVFSLAGKPKHAARQLHTGLWASKLGPMEEIEHALHDLTGLVYGSVVLVMKRRRPIPTPVADAPIPLP